MSEENKPCPFCGCTLSIGTAVMSLVISLNGSSAKEIVYYVLCRKCHAHWPIAVTEKEAWQNLNVRRGKKYD